MVIEVSYPMKFFPKYDDLIEKIVGTDSAYSGAGFGTRDLGFEIPEDQTIDIISRLKKSGLDITIVEV